MTENADYCTCGEPLKAGEAVCPECLLAAGFRESTVATEDSEQVTLTLASSPLASRQTHPDDGNFIGGYRDLEALRDWSGGTIFRAYHRGLDRWVLLHVLESSADAETRQEFLSRAERLSRLNHPNAVSILEAGEYAGSAFVAEELVDGTPVGEFLPRSWRDRWREGFFPCDEAIRAMRDAALGLHAIHETGLVHGHLNPDSLLMDPNGMIRVVGLESASETTDDRFAAPADVHPNHSVAGDIHRLGATFFFLVTGILPSEADPSLSHKTLARKMQKLNKGIRRDFCQVVARCLDQRSCPHQSAEDVATTLDPYETALDDATKLNPYENTLDDATHLNRYEIAKEVATDLNRLLKKQITPASRTARSYSMALEMFGLLIVLGLIRFPLMNRFEMTSIESSIFLLVAPLVYIALFETLFGWTPVRRLFGLRLLNHAGDRFCLGRRLARVVLKFGLLAALFVFPALMLPLVAMLNLHPYAALGLGVLSFVSPFLLLHLLARWIPSQWTFYDLLAGVTWAEETSVLPNQLTANQADPEAAQQSQVVDHIDQYDIHETLGIGGMGQVYRAHDTILDRGVAIKTLVGHLMDDPVLLERFQREARLAAKVSHSNVAKVFGTGIWNNTPYIAMELVDGRNLQEVIAEEGPLCVATAWNHIIHAAEALAAADRSGVVHRDIKPANLMVTRDGQLKVTDFGVSRQTKVDHSVTAVGTIVGTPAYMAPEQAMGKDVDCRCDIYALGMTLYHMLTGRPPFKGNNVGEILAQQMSELPPSLLDQVSELTPAQNTVLLEMIAKNPDDRYGSYDALLVDLRRYAPGVDRLASPTKRIAAEVCNFAGALLLYTVTIMFSFLLFVYQGRTAESGASAVVWTMAAFPAAFALLYVFTIGRYGATPGKRFLALQVARPNGQRVGYIRSAVRFAVAFPLFVIYVPIIIYGEFHQPLIPSLRYIAGLAVWLQVVVLAASLVMLWFHPRRRTVHDLVAGTIVLRNDA